MKFEVNDDKGVLGQVFEILHIIVIMTMAIQCEKVFLGVLDHSRFFLRAVIPIQGTWEKFINDIGGVLKVSTNLQDLDEKDSSKIELKVREINPDQGPLKPGPQ